MLPSQTSPRAIEMFYDRHRIWIERGTILLIALLVRIACGYIFFGSTDLITSVENNDLIMRGVWTKLPYLPAIDTFIWFGGVLNAYTPLPLAFCYKIFPILFDGLIAALIYDIALRRGLRRPFSSGLLYSLCPVPIIVVCIHGQWNSPALFLLLLAFHIREHYRDTPHQSFAFGLLFGLSILAKPVGLVFLLIFFKRYVKAPISFYLRQYLGALAGLIVAGFLGLTMLHLYDYPIWDSILGIVTYAGKGGPLFGLPFGYPAIFHYINSNYLLIPVFVLFAGLYYARIADVFTTILLSFAFIYAVAGLAPQYLVWIVAPLIITQSFRGAAVYTLIATSFLLLYYINRFNPNNMNTYVTLKGFEWLMPSLYFARRSWTKVARFLGYYALPLFSAGLIIDIIALRFKSIRKRGAGRDIVDTSRLSRFIPLRSGYIWTAGIVTAFLSAMALMTDRVELLPVLLRRIGEKISLYAVNPGDAFPLLKIDLAGNYPATSTVDIITILFVLTLIWSFCSAFLVSPNKGRDA